MSDRGRFPAPKDGEDFSCEEERVLRSVIAAGPGAIQLRDKGLDGARRVRRARILLGSCRAHGVKLLVNGRVDVALAAGSDGVHLPGDGLPPADVRRILAPGAVLGRSVHGEDEIDRVLAADFVFFGPVFDTPSKRAFGPPQGLRRLARICALSPRPVVAVGGIGPENVAPVLDAGARGVAVIGAVLDATDPAAAVARIVEALDRAT